jgi:hypothetical protein
MLRDDDGAVVMKDEEIGSDLFRELIFRFSARRDVVVDLFAGSFSSAVAALANNRQYVGISPKVPRIGFETDATRYELGVTRLLDVARVMLEGNYIILPGLAQDDVSGVAIPAEMFPTNFEELLACPSDLAGAQLDAAAYNLVIETSTIKGAGLGVFSRIGQNRGTIIGYYWGKVLVAESLEARVNNNRILATGKYVLGEDRKKRFLHIVGCLRCAAGYVNDPRTILKKPNAQFLEYDSLTYGFQMVALILLDDIACGEEIFASYGEMYNITSTPMAVLPDEEETALANETVLESQVMRFRFYIGCTPRGGCGGSHCGRDGSHCGPQTGYMWRMRGANPRAFALLRYLQESQPPLSWGANW